MSPSNRGTVSAPLFVAVLEAMERRGVSGDPVLAACGLRREHLRSPFARVDAALDHEFWAAAERATDDPALGLEVGIEIARQARQHVLSYIAFNSGTVRDLLRNAERFGKLLDDRGHIQLLERGTLATVYLCRDGGYPRAHGWVEMVFAALTALVRERVAGFRLARVQLRRPRPSDTAPYIGVFGVEPCFDADRPELRFDRAFLDRPLSGADVTLAEILKEHASALLAKVPEVDPLLYSVQTALSGGLERGQVGLHAIARATGTSARTLRRRLSSMGTSFHRELDQLRRDLAVQRLHGGRDSISEIAERLGFQSPTAFQRAFRRWTGLSPSAYRQQRAAREPVRPSVLNPLAE